MRPHPHPAARALCMKAAAHDAAGRPDAALADYARAAGMAPHDEQVQLLHGMALHGRHRYAEALAAFQRVRALVPSDYTAANYEADSLRRLDRHHEALQAFNAIAQAFPDRSDAWSNLAGILVATGHGVHALQAAQRALALDARNHRALAHAAEALKELGEWDTALAMLNEAVGVAPDDAVLRFNRSLLLLQLGRWREGWAEHEWRRRVPGLALGRDDLPTPVWDGGSLEGRHVVVNPEQGLGDEVMLARFVADLAARGATVTLRCYAPLLRLLRSVPGATRVIARTDPVPPHDVHVDGFSLPHRLGLSTPEAVSGRPYLAPYGPCPDAIAAALPRDCFTVGLVWTGNPLQVQNARRSVPPEQLAAVLDLPHVRFVSVQKHVGEQHPGLPAAFGDRVTDLAPILGDMNDTAHAMRRLDVLVTMCSSPAHVGGALGVPTWVLLGHVADWRWLTKRDDSPWYDSVRLFRQETPYQWEAPIARLRAALAERAAAWSPPSEA